MNTTNAVAVAIALSFAAGAGAGVSATAYAVATAPTCPIAVVDHHSDYQPVPTTGSKGF